MKACERYIYELQRENEQLKERLKLGKFKDSGIQGFRDSLAPSPPRPLAPCAGSTAPRRQICEAISCSYDPLVGTVFHINNMKENSRGAREQRRKGADEKRLPGSSSPLPSPGLV